MINEKELKKEKDYLRNVLYLLEKGIEKASSKVSEITDDAQDEMKYAWDATNRLSDVEFAYAIADVHKKSLSKDIYSNNIRSFKRMIKSAYFARFDFDDGEDVLPIYMGIATLENDNFFYIYDWRASICSMFYDYELGDASYTTPAGQEIHGKIVLKRQYKIEGDEIKEIFDTDMQIIDDILKQMLQNNTDGKMKNIVNTIQKEQNKIIRKNDVDVLVVTGPAGSGKTSVAMHKIAYILYSGKNKIRNSNVLILSPNDIFSNYVSNVLPQIGENNVYQTTFGDYIKTFLKEYKVLGSLPDIYEKVYSGAHDDSQYYSIKLKFDTTFVHVIEKYLQDVRSEVLGIHDIIVDGKCIIDKEYLEKFAAECDNNGLSYLEQSRRLKDKIILHATIKTQNDKVIVSKLNKSLQSLVIRPKEIYNKLYENRDKFVKLIEDVYNLSAVPKEHRLSINELDKIYNFTSANISKGILPYEDVYAYLYLKDRLLGSISQTKIKYAIIDEAQDYSLMQFKILSGLFRNANVTILGDLNQSILPFSSYKSFDTVMNILNDGREKPRSESMHLGKTYRSTTQINTFAKSIIPDSPLYNQIERNGDEVVIVKAEQAQYYNKIITEAINLKKKYNTVAIITKTQVEADKFKDYINVNKKNNYAKVYTKNDKVFASERVIIIPSYLAKGLEFDAVLVSDASANKYTEEEKNLFYVVCTRALHKLVIYHIGELTDIIKKTQNCDKNMKK